MYVVLGLTPAAQWETYTTPEVPKHISGCSYPLRAVLLVTWMTAFGETVATRGLSGSPDAISRSV